MSLKTDPTPEPETPRAPPPSAPPVLPIFPLSGVLLLPRGRLPLNIFEPRYLAMVEDVLGDHRMIGMVQPVDAGCRSDAPTVYPIGCAGRITSFSESGDGRYIISLTGISRFRIDHEIEGRRGYRLIAADWDEFDGDLGEGGDGVLDRPRLLRALKVYFKATGLSVDWSALEAAPDERLVTSLAMICPFPANEKQALLEAPDLAARANLLITLVEMAILDCDGGGSGVRRH